MGRRKKKSNSTFKIEELSQDEQNKISGISADDKSKDVLLYVSNQELIVDLTDNNKNNF